MDQLLFESTVLFAERSEICDWFTSRYSGHSRWLLLKSWFGWRFFPALASRYFVTWSHFEFWLVYYCTRGDSVKLSSANKLSDRAFLMLSKQFVLKQLKHSINNCNKTTHDHNSISPKKRITPFVFKTVSSIWFGYSSCYLIMLCTLLDRLTPNHQTRSHLSFCRSVFLGVWVLQQGDSLFGREEKEPRGLGHGHVGAIRVVLFNGHAASGLCSSVMLCWGAGNGFHIRDT